jgi:ribosome-associated protein
VGASPETRLLPVYHRIINVHASVQVDIEPIQEQLDKIKAKSAHATRELHQLERWRERLLSGDKQAVTEFLAKHPQADA